MQTLTDEQAICQWQAVVRMPPRLTDRHWDRLLAEQPALVRFVTALADNTEVSSVDIGESSTTLDRHGYRFAEVMLRFAATLNEFFWREHRRPLRPISWVELWNHWNALIDDLAHRMEPSAPGEISASTDLKCSQMPLLQGLEIALLTDLEIVEGNYPANSPLILRLLVDAFSAAASDNSGPAEPAEVWTADRIEEALSTPGDPYRREALAAADRFRSDLVPRFLTEVESWLPASDFLEREDEALGINVLFLLAAWREPAAQPLFFQLCRSADKPTRGLLTDLLSEDRSSLMAAMFAKNPEMLLDLIREAGTYESIQEDALKALDCLLVWGELPRKEFIGHLSTLLTATPALGPEAWPWCSLIELVANTGTWELTPEVKRAMEQGFIEPDFMTLEEFTALRSEEHELQRLEFVRDHPPLTDVATASDWLDRVDESAHLWQRESTEPDLQLEAAEDRDLPYLPEPLKPYRAPTEVGRNDPCPCGSGRKFKKCCGA